MKSGRVLDIQFGLAIAFLAVVPNVATADDKNTLAIVLGFIVVAIGQLGPLTKC